MEDFNQELNRRLEDLREQGLYREVRRMHSPQLPHVQVEGRWLLNFSSNDYLGLANDPALKEAAIRAVERYGAGSGASRLISGSLAPHNELDQAIAAFKGVEAAVSFSSGYAAAVGTLGALVDKDDVVVIDKLAHACVVDGARLCGAKLRVFDHNDLNDLAKILRWADRREPGSARSRKRRSRTLIVTESLFSMDGDMAPLRELADLKDRHGAWLMVDEAHATGLYGKNRRGLAEEQQVAERIEIHMGTLGKALGSAGGYIAGSRPLIDLLINRARSFLFSTAPVPAAAAAGLAGIRFVQSDAGEARRQRLWSRVEEISKGLQSGIDDRTGRFHLLAPQGELPLTAKGARSPILPLVVGQERRAVDMALALRSNGVFIPAVRYPTVARGEARLRLTVSAAHTSTDVAQLLTALSHVRAVPGE
jgi:8-amino-7-oxononanoate synthase